MHKRCFKCQQEKPLDEFYKHSQMADGHLNKCIECTKKDMAIYRLQNLEKVRAYDNVRAKQRKRQLHSRLWNIRYPQRYKAHNALNNAVRDGRIKKPNQCEVCGKEGKIHGHHEDYTQPLVVIWLCPECHAQIQ